MPRDNCSGLLHCQDTGKVIKHAAEERIGVVTVMDVDIDFIDQLINIENNKVFVGGKLSFQKWTGFLTSVITQIKCNDVVEEEGRQVTVATKIKT